MPNGRRVLIIEENGSVPLDKRVWYEATTLRDAGWRVAVICRTVSTASGNGKAIDWTRNPLILEGVSVYRFPLVDAESGALNYLREYLSAFLAIARGSWRVWRGLHFDVIHF